MNPCKLPGHFSYKRPGYKARYYEASTLGILQLQLCSVSSRWPGKARLFSLLSLLAVYDGGIGGEEVIHLVTKGGFTEETASLDKVANGHLEVVGSNTPVGDRGEGMCC